MIPIFQSFFKETYHKINVEDMQTILKTPEKYIIIHTLTSEYQDCLLPGTVPDTREESVINEMLTRVDIPDKPIVIYGKNARDKMPEKKAKQLQSLGIREISIYSGGIFEWLLLNEVYGDTEFPVESRHKIHDIWKYR